MLITEELQRSTTHVEETADRTTISCALHTSVFERGVELLTRSQKKFPLQFATSHLENSVTRKIDGDENLRLGQIFTFQQDKNLKKS